MAVMRPQCNGAIMACVSKGCIAVKGNTKLGAAKDDSLHVKKLDAYKELNLLIDEKTEDVHEKVCSGIFVDIVKFAKNSAQLCDEKDIHFQSAKRIPTAVLMTGANIPDHSGTFSRLKRELKRQVSVFVSLLQAEDCTNLKTVIQSMVTQITQEMDLNADLKKVNCTMPVLQGCYKNYHDTLLSPKKRKSPSKTGAKPKPNTKVIVVIEDLEGADLDVIENFILICSEYSSTIPFVFVIGIPTSVSSIHRLAQTVLDKLNLKNFSVASPTDYLTEVVSHILLSAHFPFKVGPRVYKLMEYNFLCHDFSINNFIKTFKFCLMEHFGDRDLPSVLCCRKDKIKSMVGSLSASNLDNIRKLVSFRHYVESRPKQERAALLLKDDVFLAIIPELLQDVHDYHKNLVPALRCLHALVSQLPKYPLGRQLRELYGYCLESDIFNTQDYKQALRLIKLLSNEEFITKASQALNVFTLKDAPVFNALQTMKDKIQQKISNLQEHCEQFGCESENETGAALEVKRSRYDFQKMMKELGDTKKSKRQSDYTVTCRNEIVDLFDEMFRKFLHCPKMMPLYECFYYDDVANVKQHLVGNPRAAIQSALSNPSRYLQCKCCDVTDPGSITGQMPDIVILYKLHLECGKMINMHDWFESFVTIKTESNSDEVRKQMQIRFTHAVSELQFLGFVQPTQRKSDHVARLTWGGC